MSLYLGESTIQRLRKEKVKKWLLSQGARRGRKGRVPVGVWDDCRNSQGPASGALVRTFGRTKRSRLTQRGVSSLHPALPRPRQLTNNPFIHSPSHPPTHPPPHAPAHSTSILSLALLEPSCPPSTHSLTISSRTSPSTHSTNYPFTRRPSSFDSADKQNPPGQDLGHTVG